MKQSQISRVIARAVTALLTVLSVTGCSLMIPGAGASLSVLSYNVENLFDDTTDGTEYPEYDPSNGDWTTAAYHRKMANIAEVIRASVRGAPDVVALQEIEHEVVLTELRDAYLSGCGYRFLAAADDPESAIQVGVLSRVPLRSVSSHRFQTGDGPSRSILQVELEFADETITLFNCHWKSKSGGAAETEPVRMAYAEVLADRINRVTRVDPAACVVVVGDLNERPDEYHLVGESYYTALLPAAGAAAPADPGSHLFIAAEPPVESPMEQQTGRCAEVGVVLFSPWFGADEPGSYMFEGRWERIDHVLLSESFYDGKGVEFDDFHVVQLPFMLTDQGRPLRWNLRTMNGFSDHLPLVAVFRR